MTGTPQHSLHATLPCPQRSVEGSLQVEPLHLSALRMGDERFLSNVFKRFYIFITFFTFFWRF